MNSQNNNENYENHRIPIENYENHENHKIIIENNENHLNIKIQKNKNTIIYLQNSIWE